MSGLSEAAQDALRVQQVLRIMQGVGEREMRAFLTALAVEGNVAPSTQGQAKSALLFLVQQVLSREVGFLDIVTADKPERLPVVLSRDEVSRLLPEFQSTRRLMFLVMYGAGLRHAECRRLRVKDVCFDEGHIVVRCGKGEKDRITVLPDCCRQDLIEQVERVRRLHQRDLRDGQGMVYLPYALERKYPNENRDFGWQWLFPATKLSKDPRSGTMRRHHVGEDFFAWRWSVPGSRRMLCLILCVIVFCDSSPGGRCRYSNSAGITGPFRCADDHDLYACHEQARHCCEESGGWVVGGERRTENGG